MKKILLFIFLCSFMVFVSLPASYANGEEILKNSIGKTVEITKKSVISSAKATKHIVGILGGLTVGPFVGGFRGFLKGWHSGTKFAAGVLGDENGSVQKAIGFFPAGFFIGFGGGYYGFLMGAYDGITHGISDPLSKENFSLTGESLLDYELL